MRRPRKKMGFLKEKVEYARGKHMEVSRLANKIAKEGKSPQLASEIADLYLRDLKRYQALRRFFEGRKIRKLREARKKKSN